MNEVSRDLYERKLKIFLVWKQLIFEVQIMGAIHPMNNFSTYGLIPITEEDRQKLIERINIQKKAKEEYLKSIKVVQPLKKSFIPKIEEDPPKGLDSLIIWAKNNYPIVYKVVKRDGLFGCTLVILLIIGSIT